MHIILAEAAPRAESGPFLAALGDLGVAGGMMVTLSGIAPLLEALRAATGTPPDLVAVDLSLEEAAGSNVLRRVVAVARPAPVVVTGPADPPGAVLNAARAGAAGFLPRNMGAAQMTAALRLVLLGERFFPACALETLTFGGLPTPRSSPVPDGDSGNPLGLLSPRERDILALTVEGGTNKAIARRLAVQEITVKVHLRNVYRKLGAVNRAQAVRIALENGWKPQGGGGATTPGGAG